MTVAVQSHPRPCEWHEFFSESRDDYVGFVLNSAKFEELKLAFEVPTKSHFVAVNNQVSVVSRHYVTNCDTWYFEGWDRL